MYKSLKIRYKPERSWPTNPADPFPFEGGIPVLQFINTYRNRGGVHRKEYLENYEDFLAWCNEFKIIDLEDYNGLNLEGHCYEHEANHVWQRVIKLRETVYEFINCTLRSKQIHEDAIAYFNEMVGEANTHLRFELNGNTLQVMWFKTHEELAAPLWIIVKQATILLQSANFNDIKKCNCGKFYLDTTRNKNRQWCNPLVCGNAVRTKKYKERKMRIVA
ncbi:CGNR zinc finger domain-containing protein [Mucilaginibacter sp. OK098]|uniref:CGNR zinc finger domain-containing protein n=1 Tax=Mucilaginibacter sp. OK098 TaxID=1855297 RepID=UPI000912C50D|nr:CGNR zinc finger domain-containing protein [Mucilaginibacter sp. OK098]SHN17710.1 Putative stress-induced transcription regulator [Mucilaginibacter sp. OK098]